MEIDKDGYIKCKHCKGKGEYKVPFKYKGKEYHYFSKCGHCYAEGKIDWVASLSRPEGILGFFIDSHPAGSLCLVGEDIEEKTGLKSGVYDGHEYISLKSERGEALYHELCRDEEEED